MRWRDSARRPDPCVSVLSNPQYFKSHTACGTTPGVLLHAWQSSATGLRHRPATWTRATLTPKP
eukprot:349602-Chlamydomonas_euryale.AAC.6